MKQSQLTYAIIQYSSRPESYEYVNVGVAVFDRARNLIELRLATDFSRVRRIFKDVNVSFLKVALEDFGSRVRHEFASTENANKLMSILARSSSSFRMTSVLPVFGSNISFEAELLFDDLVDQQPPMARDVRVDRKLADAFREQGVLKLLDRKPDPVRIEKYNIDVKAKYGFQNGKYNLIDVARFDQPVKALEEAGKRFFEGRALSETLGHRLIVVGDFGEQKASFFRTIQDDLARAEVKLYRLNEIDGLSGLIRSQVNPL